MHEGNVPVRQALGSNEGEVWLLKSSLSFFLKLLRIFYV